MIYDRILIFIIIIFFFSTCNLFYDIKHVITTTINRSTQMVFNKNYLNTLLKMYKLQANIFLQITPMAVDIIVILVFLMNLHT